MPVESKYLGRRTEYPSTYSSEVLVPVPRQINRTIYDITDPNGLFCGTDSWHVYEASFLTAYGKPICGVVKIVYPSTSEYLVESKSLKLYFASFNMYVTGDDKDEAIRKFTEIVTIDLSRVLQTEVKVCFYASFAEQEPFDFGDYEVLEDLPETEKTIFSIYQEQPSLLTEHPLLFNGEIKVCSHLLKSNCKITKQPDWGSVYIRMKSQSLPDKVDLLRYVVSLRNENHFHEEICEMIYKRLSDLFEPEVLMVACLYTRRGGIDICPVRASAPDYLPEYLPQADALTKRTFRQ